jgi:hypothetical protein
MHGVAVVLTSIALALFTPVQTGDETPSTAGIDTPSVVCAGPTAGCRNPAPRAVPVPKAWSGFRCGSGFYSSGGACAPHSSAKYGIGKTSRGFRCGSGYYSSGDMCIAHSSACHGFAKGGSCPSGYYSSGDMCISH